jgi:hypothetical protein
MFTASITATTNQVLHIMNPKIFTLPIVNIHPNINTVHKLQNILNIASNNIHVHKHFHSVTLRLTSENIETLRFITKPAIFQEWLCDPIIRQSYKGLRKLGTPWDTTPKQVLSKKELQLWNYYFSNCLFHQGICEFHCLTFDQKLSVFNNPMYYKIDKLLAFLRGRTCYIPANVSRRFNYAKRNSL